MDAHAFTQALGGDTFSPRKWGMNRLNITRCVNFKKSILPSIATAIPGYTRVEWRKAFKGAPSTMTIFRVTLHDARG